MFSAPIPEDDAERLATLHSYAILDTAPEQGYEDVTALATHICAAPYSLVTFVDKDRQWFKSELGFGASETGRSESFCACALLQPETMVVEDALLDPRFVDNPFVLGGPRIRFYAGAPIIAPNGHILGTVCVFDDKPRTPAPRQIAALEALARQVMSLLEQRRTIARLEDAIAKSKTADQVVQNSERRLRTLVDSFPTLAWVANADGYITWYNHRWYEYTGTTPAQMEGWGWQSVHDPKLLPSVMERWQQSIQTQQPFEMIFPLRGADGVLRSFMTRIVPVRDLDGRVMQWFGSNTEVDELHRTRAALEASEAGLRQVAERLTMAQETGRMAAWEWDLATGNFIWEGGSEWTYGRPPSQMTHADLIMTYIHEDDRDRVSADLAPAIEGWGVYRSEFRVIWPDGSVHWMLGFGKGILSPEGKPVRLIGINIDVTDRKLAEAALMQTEKLVVVGRLASSIAHEINNPLEAVTNLIYLASASDDMTEIRFYLKAADGELRRTSAIASQTLRFHKQSTRPTAVTCDDLIGSVLGIYTTRLANGRIEVEKRKRANTPVVCFDGEIRQVLSNLVGNAIDAMSNKGGRLLMRSREGHDWKTGRDGLVLTVADTGMGMSAATVAKLFNAFFTTKGIGGTGLGLWISKEIVERHRGRMQVRSSQGSGHSGTVFAVFLPFDPAVR